MCPFCYIGKRKFESALGEFTGKNNIEITWKSFQLDPDLQVSDHKDHSLYLQQKKGFTAAQVTQMLDHVTSMAAQAGLTYHLDKAVMANSFDAHRFTHLAHTHGLQDKAEEALFTAHFTDGKDIADREVLTALGQEIGLDPAEVQQVLNSEAYATDVQHDISEARQLGVSGVPFFVFNRKYAISGAQDSAAFLQTLEKSFGEWREANPAVTLEVLDGPSCTPEGECN